MFLFPIKFMPVKEYLEFLDVFGFVVVKDGNKLKLQLPYLGSAESEKGKVFDYITMSPIMETLLETTAERYRRVLELESPEWERKEWKKKYETFLGWQAAYLRGEQIHVNDIGFKKE